MTDRAASDRLGVVAVIVVAALALMATSPPLRAEIRDEAVSAIRLAAGEAVTVTLVASLNEAAFAEPFHQEPSLRVWFEGHPDGPVAEGQSTPLVTGELRAMDPDGTVFGRPEHLVETGYVDLLPFCGAGPGCEQHFRVVVGRRGDGPEVSVTLHVSGRAEYDGDRGDEPPGAALDVQLLEMEPYDGAPPATASGDPLSPDGGGTAGSGPALPTASGEALVIDVVDEGWPVTRPVDVSIIRVGDGDDPVFARVRDGGSVELRGGGDRWSVDARNGATLICGLDEPCPEELELGFRYGAAQGSQQRATVELYSSDDWLVQPGGTRMPSLGPARSAEASGVVELSPERPQVDLDHVLTIEPEHQPEADDGLTGALLELTTPAISDGAEVRATFGPEAYERTLTASRPEVSVSTWLEASFPDGQFRAPVPVSLELVGDEPVAVTWRLEVGIDPVSWELPLGPITLAPEGGSG